MPTRAQTEFERSLIDALRSSNVTDAVSEAIISGVTKKLAERFNYYDAKIASLEAEIQLIKSNKSDIVNTTPADQKRMEQKIDILQQSAKNNNIRLMGLEEADSENISLKVKELFAQKLKINISEEECNAVYRVGRIIESRPRHVVVSFKDNSLKNKIYTKKKLLKGSGIVMKEDLTAERLAVVKEASTTYGFKNVWTFNGNVFVKSENGVEKIL